MLNIIGIKITATNLGLEKITLHGRTLCLYFSQDKTQPFKRPPESAFFTKLIEKIAGGRKEKYRLVNDKEKLNVLIHTDGKDDAARMEELRRILSA